MASDAPASVDDLQFQYDKERFIQTTKRDNSRHDVEANRQEQDGRFGEAAEHTSPMHVLGNQGDGRSGSQQLEAERLENNSRR